jgi:hypothetical protein
MSPYPKVQDSVTKEWCCPQFAVTFNGSVYHYATLSDARTGYAQWLAKYRKLSRWTPVVIEPNATIIEGFTFVPKTKRTVRRDVIHLIKLTQPPPRAERILGKLNMSNLKTKFTSKLVKVIAKEYPRTGTRYIGIFEDGSSHQIRKSDKRFVSVTQHMYGDGSNSDFSFSSKYIHSAVQVTR